jgi:hypothetical protein
MQLVTGNEEMLATFPSKNLKDKDHVGHLVIDARILQYLKLFI